MLALALTLVGFLGGQVMAQAQSSRSLDGLVRDSAGTPLAEVEIALDSLPVSARTDTLGRFVMSNLPSGLHTVRVEKPGFVAMLLRIEIPHQPRDASHSLGQIVLRQAPARLLRVSITFADATTGRRVEGVVVSAGRRAVGYGDRAGRFRADSVSVRSGDEWSFRRLGYQAVTFQLWPSEEQDAVDLAVKLKPLAITLGPVIVEGDISKTLTPWIREFEQRRQRGRGTFLGEVEIQRHRASLSATNLLSWAGVFVLGDLFTPVTNPRRLRVRGSRCYPPGPPVIFLDGIRLSEETAILWLDNYAPDQVAGVEVYNSAAQIPPMFNATGSDCGVIAVWTKR